MAAQETERSNAADAHVQVLGSIHIHLGIPGWLQGNAWHQVVFDPSGSGFKSSTAEPLKGPGWLTQACQIHGEVIRGMARESGRTCRASSQTRYVGV